MNQRLIISDDNDNKSDEKYIILVNKKYILNIKILCNNETTMKRLIF